MVVHQHHREKIAHALGVVRIVDAELGFDEAEKWIVFFDAHELIRPDRGFPVTLEQLGVALDERYSRHRDAVRPAVRFVVLDEIVKLVKTALEKLRQEWI